MVVASSILVGGEAFGFSHGALGFCRDRILEGETLDAESNAVAIVGVRAFDGVPQENDETRLRYHLRGTPRCCRVEEVVGRAFAETDRSACSLLHRTSRALHGEECPVVRGRALWSAQVVALLARCDPCTRVVLQIAGQGCRPRFLCADHEEVREAAQPTRQQPGPPRSSFRWSKMRGQQRVRRPGCGWSAHA